MLFVALVLSALAQDWVSIPLATGNDVPIMSKGPDGYLYVAANKSLTKLDPADWQHPVWARTLDKGDTTQPVGACFQKDLGLVFEVIPRTVGFNTSPFLWANIPLDNSSIAYHQIGGQNGIGGFGGSGCAVDDKDTLFLTSSFQGIWYKNGQSIMVIDPSNPDQPIMGPDFRYPISDITASPDGKTLLVLYKDWTSPFLALIQNQKVVPFGDMPYLALPFNPGSARFSPDGGKVFLSGNNNKDLWGMMTFDVASRTLGPVHTADTTIWSPLMYPPSDFAWSGTDAYYLLCGNVVPYDPATWKPQGSLIPNPDGSGSNTPCDNDFNNYQLMVYRKQFVDTFVVLQIHQDPIISYILTGQILIWDSPRTPVAASVVDGATFVRPPSPGNWATVFGRALSFTPTVGAPSGGAYPAQLDAARVQLQYAGKTAYAQVYYVSPSQINFLVPADAPLGTGMLNVTPQTVNADGSWTPGNTLAADVAAFSPGIYAITDESGRVISEARGAALGSTITQWAGGLGTVQSGKYGLMWTTTPPTVTVGGVTADVVFSGLAPGFVGLYQVNVVLPAAVAGTVADLQMAIGGLQTTVKVLINARGQ